MMTSLVCEEPTSSSVSVPIRFCIGVMYIQWQTAELLPDVTLDDKKVNSACKYRGLYFRNEAESRKNLPLQGFSFTGVLISP